MITCRARRASPTSRSTRSVTRWCATPPTPALTLERSRARSPARGRVARTKRARATPRCSRSTSSAAATLERAAELYVIAAEQAIAGNDYVAALAHGARGAGLGAERRGTTLAMLRLRQAEAHHWRGEYAESASARARPWSSSHPGAPWCAAVGELGVSYARAAKTDEAPPPRRCCSTPSRIPTAWRDLRVVGRPHRGRRRTARHAELTARLAALAKRLAPSAAPSRSVACRLAQLRAMRAYFAGDHEIRCA